MTLQVIGRTARTAVPAFQERGSLLSLVSTPCSHPSHLSHRGALPTSFGPGKQTLRIFDGDDAVHQNHFRVIVVPRQARSEELVVSCGLAVGCLGEAQSPEDCTIHPPIGGSSAGLLPP